MCNLSLSPGRALTVWHLRMRRANNTQIDTCTFAENTAGQEAGAVFYGNLQYAGLILDSKFSNNSAGVCRITSGSHWPLHPRTEGGLVLTHATRAMLLIHDSASRGAPTAVQHSALLS